MEHPLCVSLERGTEIRVWLLWDCVWVVYRSRFKSHLQRIMSVRFPLSVTVGQIHIQSLTLPSASDNSVLPKAQYELLRNQMMAVWNSPKIIIRPFLLLCSEPSLLLIIHYNGPLRFPVLFCHIWVFLSAWLTLVNNVHQIPREKIFKALNSDQYQNN